MIESNLRSMQPVRYFVHADFETCKITAKHGMYFHMYDAQSWSNQYGGTSSVGYFSPINPSTVGSKKTQVNHALHRTVSNEKPSPDYLSRCNKNRFIG